MRKWWLFYYSTAIYTSTSRKWLSTQIFTIFALFLRWLTKVYPSNLYYFMPVHCILTPTKLC